MRLVVVVGRHWPLLSDLGRPRDGPVLSRSADGRHFRCALSGPQPTTVRHDGGCANRSRTRVPHCTPTGLNHAACAVDRSRYRRPAPDDGGRPSPQLGKLRSFAACSCAYLGERPGSRSGSLGDLHRVSPSPLDLVRLRCGRGGVPIATSSGPCAKAKCGEGM